VNLSSNDNSDSEKCSKSKDDIEDKEIQNEGNRYVGVGEYNYEA